MSRIQHVQETNASIIERRLRPIYDSLDFGNYKKALQEVEKVLKKSPTIQCARALKALALLRLGKETECELNLNSLLAEKPSDEATLQVMTICYREMNQGENICIAYDNAVKQSPWNEELLSHLFMAYARVCEYKSQQNTALALYKLKPKNPYYFWAVMSVVLQATKGSEKDNPTKRSLLLALSERMVSKMISDDKMEAEQECQLYLIILELQEKFKEALDFLKSPICIKLFTESTMRHRINLLKKLQMWPELNSLCETNLRNDMDNWECYLDYFASSFELLGDEDEQIHSNNSVNKNDLLNTNLQLKQRMHKCLNFILELINAAEGTKLRGPFLARLELYRRMFEYGYKDEELEQQYIHLMVDYFRKFGDRGCCVGDLRASIAIIPFGYNENDTKPYLKNFNTRSLAVRLIEEVGISPTVLPQSKQQMLRHISVLQLSRLCGAHLILSSEHLEALFTALTLHYENGRANYGKDLLVTDFGPSDAYALIAGHVMFDLAKKTRSSEPLMKALALLKYVLSNSRSNFHIKLLCLQIYHLLGCGLGACEIYELLEVKHLQLDSMGYLHCDPLSISGTPSNIQKLHDATLNFFTNNYKDSIEHLILSYKFGSFSKLFEFLDFRQRLAGSLHYTTITIDRMLHDLIRHPNVQCDITNVLKNIPIISNEEKIDWSKASDNRDLKVITDWEPNVPKILNEIIESEDTEKYLINNVNIDIKASSFEQSKDCSRLRSFVLEIVIAVMDLLKDNMGDREKKVGSLLQLKNELKDTFIEIRNKKHPKIQMHKLSSPMPSRLHGMLEMPYEQAFYDISSYAIWIAGHLPDSEINPSMWSWPQVLAENVEQTIKFQNSCDDAFWTHRSAKEKIVNTIEILSLSTLCCGVCCDLKRLSENKLKKSKKKPAAVVNSSPNPVSVLITCLNQTLESIQKSLDLWLCPKAPEDLTDKLVSLSIDDLKVQQNAIFSMDFVMFVKEYQTLVKDNIKYLNKLNI